MNRHKIIFTIPAHKAHEPVVSDRMARLKELCGGCTVTFGTGHWINTETGQREIEHIEQHSFVYDSIHEPIVSDLRRLIEKAVLGTGEQAVMVETFSPGYSYTIKEQ